MRSCLFTRPPQSCAPTFHPLCLLYRSRAKRKMLRRVDFASAAMAGRGQLYNGCGVPRRRLVNITEPAAHTLPCGLAKGGAGYIVRQIMQHACYSGHKRGRCGDISASSCSCDLQWRWPWLGALLFVGRPSRAIKTRCQRRQNLGEKLLLLLLLLLLLEVVLVRRPCHSG